MIRRYICIITLIVILTMGLFTLTGCDSEKEESSSGGYTGRSSMDYMFPTTHDVI